MVTLTIYNFRLEANKDSAEKYGVEFEVKPQPQIQNCYQQQPGLGDSLAAIQALAAGSASRASDTREPQSVRGCSEDRRRRINPARMGA